MVEIDFDRFMDGYQAVLQLKPGTVVTPEIVGEIQYAFECQRQGEEDTVDAFHRGYLHGLEKGAGSDKAALIEKLEELQGLLAVQKALNKHWCEVSALPVVQGGA